MSCCEWALSSILKMDASASCHAPTFHATSDLDKLEILGADVSDLIYTIDHNLQHGATTRSFSAR